MADHILRFLDTYPGSSFPTRAELASGRQAIVKLRGAGNGADALLSEFVVNRLAHAAGLPVPDTAVVHLPDAFPWQYGTDEFHDLVIKSPGANLAIALVPDARPLPVERYAALPAPLISQIVTLDRVFSNWDRSTASRNLLVDRSGQVWLIDHGSCRFLHESATGPLPPLPSGHCFADQADSFDAAWLDLLTSDTVSEVAAAIPDDWLQPTAHARTTLLAALEARLALARVPGVRPSFE